MLLRHYPGLINTELKRMTRSGTPFRVTTFQVCLGNGELAGRRRPVRKTLGEKFVRNQRFSRR